MKEITYENFTQVNLAVWTITEVQPFPEARKPAWKLWIDFGEEIGTKKTSAQITDYYTSDTLIWRQVVAVVNFPPKQIGNFMSECLITWFPDSEGKTVLIAPDNPVPNGSILH